MALWLIRAGKHGEREQLAQEKNLAIIGWEKLGDLSNLKDRDMLRQKLEQTYPDAGNNRIRNHESQIWPLLSTIKNGDLVVLPLKTRPSILIGEVTDEYQYRQDIAEAPLHTRPVKWLKELPRSSFDQDLLYSFGAFMTVCQIQRNDAEKRIKNLLTTSSFREKQSETKSEPIEEENLNTNDLTQLADDQIRNWIGRKFTGHELTRLVKYLLEAQGNKVFMSPPGPDGGIDLLAGKGDIGFEPPFIAVQVKSGNQQVGTPEINQLGGVISKVGATHGLLVSWSGFKGTATREIASHYFKIRFWDSSDVIRLVQEYYDRLPEEIRAEIPLRKIWTIVADEE